MRDTEDTLIIGGGFYGLRLALYIRQELGQSVTVIEKEPTMMSRASYVNQARVHNGYHYPRSILTAYRSSVNFPSFVDEYADAIVNDFDKYYAISRQLSKINARQFAEFGKKIGVEISTADESVYKLFNPTVTEGVFKVKEYAFNSYILRDVILKRITEAGGITVHNDEAVSRVEQAGERIRVMTDKGVYTVRNVINCTYSQINAIQRRSGLPLVRLKHEVAEMCLVRLPDSLRNFSVTVMDGPFFSIMPFPSRGLHTLSHVRYTPHYSWLDDEEAPSSLHDVHAHFKEVEITSNFKKMYADVIRYVPSLKDMTYEDSISEVKTVLRKSENDDSRPILFKPDYGLKHYTCIMGGKLDNIYDVFEELKLLWGR